MLCKVSKAAKSSSNFDELLLTLALKSQTPLLIHNLPQTGIIVETSPICSDHPICSWLSVPISNPAIEQRTQGMVVVWSDQPNAFSNHQLKLLSTLGAQTAIAIDNAHPQKSVLDERDWIMEAEEQLRKMLARELHDGPIQLVSAIMMGLDFCTEALEKDPTLLPEQINYLQELAEHAVHQMRTMLLELRPVALETQGLSAALRVFLERQQKVIETTDLTLEIETHHPSGEISRQETRVEVAIYAIVQEAVNNALKHAQADTIKVHVRESPTEIYANVVDDGKGFNGEKVLHSYEQQGSLGLLNIRERAESVGGTLTIESVPGQGTSITVCVPKSKTEYTEAAKERKENTVLQSTSRMPSPSPRAHSPAPSATLA